MDIAVKLKKVSLSHKIPPKNGVKDSVMRLIKNEPFFDEQYILKNISFTLEKGSAIALIGGEGAGKTTLLRLISGIITPTSGRIITNGCISPVFSDGMGFNPSLTVKKNVYFVGSMRGFSSEYMKKRIKDIIEFAGLKEQLNAPIKKCTREMVSRLAFSISAFIKTDILIVDEALSGCDEDFCERCMEKMLEMKSRGASVLFVSYSGDQIIKLCENAIWLDNGTAFSAGRRRFSTCGKSLLPGGNACFPASAAWEKQRCFGSSSTGAVRRSLLTSWPSWPITWIWRRA